MATKTLRKQSTKGQERAEILMAAAIDLFTERDYASVTIQDITRRAGVTHSLVYYHFKNKEELFSRAVTNLIENTIKGYQVSRKHHHDPVDLIEDWFENNIRLSKELRKLVKIMFDYAGPRQGSPSVANAIKDFYAQEHRILTASVTQGISEGRFKDVDPARIATFISTHIDGIFYDSFIRADDDIARAMLDLKWALWTLLGYEEGVRQDTIRPAQLVSVASN
ncbi:MAG: TetR/AcrR family transcriptional regulator [Rhodospirillales bacterium]|nr:TetR/AcrR family transcriptional regulator [Rhodospirillales bacterium]MBT4039833.1 TetR/AcrR family transcriptional regulator [Rhodospirillales bacterium]MBT4625979.1 TetR/AcrR family transcriptional regulator [Rhodospirillales bacterium]MBT5350593.1 TetR/AcrR family transcriptional regulator [Rhodospirillales bacterium]MBT5520321.1 TetR/AcrR family transcriptional regulator [Rhodospirillales bacterium]